MDRKADDLDDKGLEVYESMSGRYAALHKELDTYKRHFPTCDAHKPQGEGARGRCLICALQTMSAALSEIDSMCELVEGSGVGLDVLESYAHISKYDIDCNEERVARNTVALLRRLL